MMPLLDASSAYALGVCRFERASVIGERRERSSMTVVSLTAYNLYTLHRAAWCSFSLFCEGILLVQTHCSLCICLVCVVLHLFEVLQDTFLSGDQRSVRVDTEFMT